MQELRYIPNVVTLQLDTEKCIGCGMCAEVCPQAVFLIEGKKALIADRDGCMECGACARNCPAEAVSVSPGVGCAAGVIIGALRGTGPSCGSGCCDDSSCCSGQER